MNNPAGAKRVLLNVKSTKSDEEIINAFFRLDHPEDDQDRNAHSIHYDPNRHHNPDSCPKGHIIIDFFGRRYPDLVLQTLPHEIYEVSSKKKSPNEGQDDNDKL